MRVVCFDIGGVLVKIHSSLQELAEAVGIDLPDHRQGDSLHFNPVMLAYQEGQLTDDEFLREFANWLGVSVEKARQASDEILIRPFEGTQEIIEQLHRANIKTGCLSNTNALHWSRLTASGAFPGVELLDLKIASHLVGRAKPDPAIFHLFAQRARVQPSEVIYFEDSPKNIEAALEVGFDVVTVNPKEETAPQISEALAERGLLG
jgi:epoxide hydrolase-like predicted phosphatase